MSATITGHAIVRLRKFLGHEVIQRNQRGDRGRPFEILTEHLVDEGWTAGNENEHSISDLNGSTRSAQDADAEFAERSGSGSRPAGLGASRR